MEAGFSFSSSSSSSFVHEILARLCNLPRSNVFYVFDDFSQLYKRRRVPGRIERAKHLLSDTFVERLSFQRSKDQGKSTHANLMFLSTVTEGWCKIKTRTECKKPEET